MRWTRLLPTTLLLLALAPVASAETTAPGRGPRGSLFPYPIHTERLDNGLRVAVVPTGAKGMVTLYEIVGVGSRDEVEPGHSGFAHFFEHMMFRGTKAFPSKERGELLAGLGVNESGFTTDDFTGYHLSGPKGALEELVALEGDRYRNLRYSEPVFRTEAKAVLGEYNKTAANPDFAAWEALRDLAYDRHTYEHTTLGRLEDIQQMPERYAYSKRFFERFYTPDNVLLLFVGDVDAEHTLALVREHFGAWRGQRAKTEVKPEPAQKAERRRHLAWKLPVSPRGQMAWKVPAGTDPKQAALGHVLNYALCSSAAPLRQELVLETGLVESLECWWEPHRDPSLFPLIWTLREGASQEAVVERVQAHMDRLARGEIDEALLEDVKSHARYSVLLSLTSAQRVADVLAWNAGATLEPESLERVLDALGEVGPDDVAAFAKAHLGREQRAIVTLAHEGEGGQAR